MRSARNRQFIDSKVQGTLLFRVTMYWAMSNVGVFILLSGFRMLLGLMIPGMTSTQTMIINTWNNFWPGFLASLLVLPFILTDVVRLSNRFVGPVFRIRRGLRELASGTRVTPLQFRDDDFWFDFAADFNEVSEAMQARDEKQHAEEVQTSA